MKTRLNALTAAGPSASADPAEGLPELAFEIPVGVIEGFMTSDHRIIDAGALKPRALPLGLSAMRVNPEWGGHGLAFVAGSIRELTRVSAAGWENPLGGTYPAGSFAWTARGFLNDDADGRWVADRIRDGSLRYVSVDLAGVESEIEITEVDEEGWPIDGQERYTAGEITGFTVCNGSAFAGCFISMTNDPADAAAEDAPAAPVTASGLLFLVPDVGPLDRSNIRIMDGLPGCEPCADQDNAAAVVAAGGPIAPPASWFTDPGLTEPTALTITDDGRVFGHLATWGTCHIGFSDKCVTPPRSATEYSAFHTGALRTAEGEDLAVGHLTMGTGHADLRATPAGAAEHYDNTGTRWADVRAGEDEFGIWIAGAVVPNIPDELVRTARGGALSGDWRRIGAGLEMVAALTVNVPGFPVPRPQAIAAGGAPLALVAAGAQAQPALHADGNRAGVTYERVMLGLARDVALARVPKGQIVPLEAKRDAALARLER